MGSSPMFFGKVPLGLPGNGDVAMMLWAQESEKQRRETRKKS